MIWNDLELCFEIVCRRGSSDVTFGPNTALLAIVYIRYFLELLVPPGYSTEITWFDRGYL